MLPPAIFENRDHSRGSSPWLLTKNLQILKIKKNYPPKCLSRVTRHPDAP